MNTIITKLATISLTQEEIAAIDATYDCLIDLQALLGEHYATQFRTPSGKVLSDSEITSAMKSLLFILGKMNDYKVEMCGRHDYEDEDEESEDFEDDEDIEDDE